jgi:hypothetical protein
MDWDARYNSPSYAYGTEPNDFLSEVADRILKGRVLCLAEGEGRNAVFLAGLGYSVIAVDGSRAGLNKAEVLAQARGVTISTVHADLTDFVIEPDSYTGIIAIYAHLPSPLRKNIHKAAVEGLCPGGVFILEAFTRAQLNYDTGGPKDQDLLMQLPVLRSELSGLEFEIAREVERNVTEGDYHKGLASVVQILGRKPID